MTDVANHHPGETDPVTGTTTTGHEWDGIRELNTPLPRWWLWTLYLTIVWAIGYWIVYPAWPTITSHTAGLFGYSSRADVAAELGPDVAYPNNAQSLGIADNGAKQSSDCTAIGIPCRRTDLGSFGGHPRAVAVPELCAIHSGSGSTIHLGSGSTRRNSASN